MEFSKEIFKTYDIRGLLEEVTEEVAYAIGVGVVTKLKAKNVVIGRDVRKTSPELLKAVIKGVTDMGGNVLDLGLTNTSVWNYATSFTEGVDLGIMITASHNPAEYNGIKVNLSSGQSVSGDELWELVQDLNESQADEKGSVQELDIIDKYIDACVEGIDLGDLSKIKIVFDYGNGMGAVSLQPLIKKLGIDVIELYPEFDATFPNHGADPSVEANLLDLKRSVVENGADFGAAFDGDLDRVMLVDNKGNAISGDIFLALLAKDILKHDPEKGVAVTVNMGWAVREAIVEAGGKVIESPVGRSSVPKAAMENDGILGGEVSGHFMFKDFAFRESVEHALVRMLSVYKGSGKTMSDLVEPMRKYANSGEVNVEVGNKDEIINRVLEKYKDQASEVSKLDGIKLIFDHDWWFILRASNTEPVLRLTVEAKTKEVMDEKVAEITALMK